MTAIGLVRVLKVEPYSATCINVQVLPAGSSETRTESGSVPGSRWLGFWKQQGVQSYREGSLA